MLYQEGGEVMASIFEIDRQFEELIDPETGELLDYDAFLELQMERDSKIDNTACWVKELTAQANAIDAEIKSLTERKKSAQAKAQRLTEYLGTVLGGEKFSSARCAISYRKSEAVEVDEELCPKKYMVKTVTVKPDKKAIKELLKTGKAVKGCTLVERQNISIK